MRIKRQIFLLRETRWRHILTQSLSLHADLFSMGRKYLPVPDTWVQNLWLFRGVDQRFSENIKLATIFSAGTFPASVCYSVFSSRWQNAWHKQFKGRKDIFWSQFQRLQSVLMGKKRVVTGQLPAWQYKKQRDTITERNHNKILFLWTLCQPGFSFCNSTSSQKYLYILNLSVY